VSELLYRGGMCSKGKKEEVDPAGGTNGDMRKAEGALKKASVNCEKRSGQLGGYWVGWEEKGQSASLGPLY